MSSWQFLVGFAFFFSPLISNPWKFTSICISKGVLAFEFHNDESRVETWPGFCSVCTILALT